MEGLHAALLDISDPKSPRYGQHLSKAEVHTPVSSCRTSDPYPKVAQYAAPKPESVVAVTGWLSAHNLTYELASPAGDLLRVPGMTIGTANSLLAANYSIYHDEETNASVALTSSYTIPPAMQDHLVFVYPTTQ